MHTQLLAHGSSQRKLLLIIQLTSDNTTAEEVALDNLIVKVGTCLGRWNQQDSGTIDIRDYVHGIGNKLLHGQCLFAIFDKLRRTVVLCMVEERKQTPEAPWELENDR